MKLIIFITVGLALVPAVLFPETSRCAETFGSGKVSKIAIFPAQIKLDGPRATHRLIVQSIEAGQTGKSVRDDVVYTSSDAKVVEVVNHLVVPRGNGQATITATWNGSSASTSVDVVDFNEEEPWNFRNHVQSLLTKLSCNSGACHGALSGKGGFRLSLRGYDSESDFHAITREARGRRVELDDPGRSLVLAKPTGAISHKGGVRFKPGSDDYQTISEWIAQGAEGPSASDSKVVAVEVLPAISVLSKGDEQPLVVRASYSDGRVVDVTQWAIFSSANETVATVSEEGEVSVIGNGEGAVVVWFASQLAIAKITSPYENTVAEAEYQSAPSRNFIDQLVTSKLRQLNLLPSARSTDAEFIRRVFLDTIGALPPTEEVKSFLASNDINKRDQLIDSLLERSEYVDYWSYRWSDILLVNGARLRPLSVKAFYSWIHGHVEKNTPWDVFVREIVTAQGSSHENGATNFFALHQSPEEMSETTSQAFMGLSLACAKCHNHPLEKWTNDQYYAMANLFSRVRAKGWGGDGRNGDGLRTLFVVDRGDLIQPLTGKPQPPATLDGSALELDATDDRRVHLANWLTSPKNPYFARSITNRVWGNFFGVGLVEQIDDLRMSNPASNEALLSAAAQYLIEQDFNLKELMRVILQSDTYQLSSESRPENLGDRRFYSRYYPRRLMSEVLLDGFSQVTDVPTEFKKIEFPGADIRDTDFYPDGTKALQLYDSAVASYFLKTFGRNSRVITCECERSNEPSLIQVLHIANGDTLNDKLAAKGNRLEKWIDEKMSPEEIVDEVYFRALARKPTKRERTDLAKELTQASEEEYRLVLEDIVWGVLSSREFLFNH